MYNPRFVRKVDDSAAKPVLNSLEAQRQPREAGLRKKCRRFILSKAAEISGFLGIRL